MRTYYELEYPGAAKPEYARSPFEAERRAQALVRARKGPVYIVECTRMKYHCESRTVVAVVR